MSQNPKTHAKKLAKILKLPELLESWVDAQLASPDQRPDLIDPKTLQRQSSHVVTALREALPSAADQPLEADGWADVRQVIEEISRDRDMSGFSPSDTSTFLLSLKRPLLERLDETGSEVFWWASDLIDSVALYSAEVYQMRREATIARQRQEMEELSSPVIKVWDSIVAMPLIGTLDTQRSQMVTEALLEALGHSGAEIAILDLTGVPAVDTRMAQHLMRTVAAARLMGADCILCGIRPQIAQTIVHLQIDLGGIVTEGSLASALRTAFRRQGMTVVHSGPVHGGPRAGSETGR